MPNFLKLTTFRFTVRYYSRLNSNLYSVINSMPKEPKHIAEAQKQRIKIKQKSLKYAPGKVTLQILGSGAKGAPSTVYLFSDQNRYLFNCGEGTQRLAHEHKMKLSKLEHIFVTYPSWRNIGGLPGTALTIQDVGVPQITLHGPKIIGDIFPATRRFVVLRDMKVGIADGSIPFEDNVMSVNYVPLHRKECQSNVKDVQVSIEQREASTSTRSSRRSRRRSSSSGSSVIEDDDTDYYAHESKHSKRNRSRSRSKSCSPNSGQNITQDSISKRLQNGIIENDISMCYVCQMQPRPGPLNLDKCVKRGVPPGPLLGKLKNGENVTLSDGTVIKSSEVCEPDDPGPIFIIVDCPTQDYLEDLVNSDALKKHQKFAQCDEEAACLVVHFTPKEVMELPEYKSWMEDFSSSTNHIPVNEYNSCMGSLAVHRIQHKLNLLSREIFPLLGDSGTPVLQEMEGEHQNKKLKMNVDVNFKKLLLDQSLDHDRRYIGSLTNFHLRPRKGFDLNSHIKLDPEEYIHETVALEGCTDALNQLHHVLESAKSKLTIKEYPRLLFLGTGSCIPNKTRNTSAILLQISEHKNILLDCGEGTYGQIVRFFGIQKVDEVLAKIDAVYISHLHADHHIGLVGLLQGRRRALNRLNLDREPVYLFAPKQILSWLGFYDKCFESIENEYVLVPNGDLIHDQQTYSEDKKSSFLKALDLTDFATCSVKHCPNAFGMTVVHRDGIKLTYSGDTMPSDNLVTLGKNSDVLIHEATMEDELAKEAVIKMHSTTSQAIQVGKDMGAKHIILTHFSQRYAKLPRFNNNFTENVSIAFDNMLVKVDELPLIPVLYPALKIMFAEQCEELETKSAKRHLRAEMSAALDS